MAEMEGELKEEASAANLDPLDNIPVDPSNTETVKDTVAPAAAGGGFWGGGGLSTGRAIAAGGRLWGGGAGSGGGSQCLR